MIKLFKRTAAAVTVSILVISCGDKPHERSSDILSYIPADSPYVFASTEALPTALADKLEPAMDDILRAYQDVLRLVMSEHMDKLSDGDDGKGEADRIHGLMEEILGLMSLEGIRGIGIERDSAFAFYGNGLLPVLRLELSDAALFDAAVERFETKAGESLQIGEAAGNAYKYADLDKINLVIATIGNQVIITPVPSAYSETQVSAALGIEMPQESVGASKTLDDISDEYGFSDLFSGYVDIQRIAGTFTGDVSDSDRQFFAALGATLPDVSDVCAAEIKAMAGIAPRIVFGYTAASGEEISSAMIVELRDDIAAGLAAVPAAVPGLGADPGGFLSLGVGFDLMELRNFYEARLDAMEANPYKCEELAGLQAAVAQGRSLLNQPIPPMVYSFGGFVANIADIDGVDLASGEPPTSIDASVLVAMENVESLVMMAAMMDPEVAALNLTADGGPVKLDLAQLEGFTDVAFAALSDNAMAIAVGADAESQSASLLTADAASPPPFMSMSVDAGRYYDLIGKAMEQEAAGDGNGEMPEAMQSAAREVVMLSGSIYERMSVDVRFTRRGIEINGRVQLSD